MQPRASLPLSTGLLALSLLLPGTGLAQGSELRVEAEAMTLSGYEAAQEADSGCIRLTGKTGTASFAFPFPSGDYELDARYLSESAGQNTYAVFIENTQVVAWLGKDKDNRWHLLSEQPWHQPRRLHLATGDKIRIEALSNKGSLAILDHVKFIPSGRANPAAKTETITLHPKEYTQAFRNPLKGFRPKFRSEMAAEVNGDAAGAPRPGHEYGTLSKMYFKWNELESKATDGVDKIRTVCDAKWKGAEALNHKIIPRVYLRWPRRESGWPSDMVEGDMSSDHFRQRVVALIKKLGAAWDNDSRVAYVEIGLIGEWGEMEWPDTTEEIKGLIAAQFATSFRNKLVMIRWPDTYNDHLYNFGYYWDSIAHQDQDYYTFRITHSAPRWKTAVIGGETAYGWGNFAVQPGDSPDDSLRDPAHTGYIINRIRKLHMNHAGWIANYNQQDPSLKAGAEAMQMALGYRFVISEITYPRRLEAGVSTTLSFRVRNTGSSPFYYNWPVEISLLDPTTRQVVWSQKCVDVDIRKWLPGDRWDEATNKYLIPAEDNLVNQRIEVHGLPEGSYILALAILDPAGDTPSARFAIHNYYKGGRHPIGMIGLGRTLQAFELTGFDDLKSDTTLHYGNTPK